MAMLLVVFTAGLCLLGSGKTAGEGVQLQSGKTAYFSLTLGTDEKLDAVYVKANTYYAAKGELKITVNTATSATPSESGWNTANALTKNFSRATGGSEAKNAYAHNWILMGEGLDRSVKTVSVSGNVSFVLEELVCLNQQGEKIKLTGYKPSNYGSFPASELAPAYDAQNSFTKSESRYDNFTAEESYYLDSVCNLLSGKGFVTGGMYVFGGDFNYLGTLLLAPSVAIFGESVFAVRLPAYLAVFAAVIFAYLFVIALTQNQAFGLGFAALLCVGGTYWIVGGMGAPYAFVASALTASAYFAYRFFAKGITAPHLVRGGLNVLLSGIFAAIALAIDSAAIFPVLAILVLFGFGMRRQKRAYELALQKTEGKEETVTAEDGTEKTVNRAARLVRRRYEDKTRICVGFALLSYLMTTVLLVTISVGVSYGAIVRANGNIDKGIWTFLFRGIGDSFTGRMVAPFGETNGANAWTWWLPLLPTMTYTGVNVVTEVAFGVLDILRLILCGLSLAAVAYTTVKVAYDVAKNKTDKRALRLRRGYFILLSGLAAAMLYGCVKAYPSALYTFLFQAVYAAFLPLAATTLPLKSATEKQ